MSSQARGDWLPKWDRCLFLARDMYHAEPVVDDDFSVQLLESTLALLGLGRVPAPVADHDLYFWWTLWVVRAILLSMGTNCLLARRVDAATVRLLVAPIRLECEEMALVAASSESRVALGLQLYLDGACGVNFRTGVLYLGTFRTKEEMSEQRCPATLPRVVVAALAPTETTPSTIYVSFARGFPAAEPAWAPATDARVCIAIGQRPRGDSSEPEGLEQPLLAREETVYSRLGIGDSLTFEPPPTCDDRDAATVSAFAALVLGLDRFEATGAATLGGTSLREWFQTAMEGDDFAKLAAGFYRGSVAAMFSNMDIDVEGDRVPGAPRGGGGGGGGVDRTFSSMKASLAKRAVPAPASRLGCPLVDVAQ